MIPIKLVGMSTSRQFRTNKKVYLKDKINELEINSANKNSRHLHRAISERKNYHPRTNLVKDKRGDVLADFHKIYFCQLLNVRGGG
jgi:hypothetical protein